MNNKQERIQIIILIVLLITITALVFAVVKFYKATELIKDNKYNFLNHNQYSTCTCSGQKTNTFYLNNDNTDIISYEHKLDTDTIEQVN